MIILVFFGTVLETCNRRSIFSLAAFASACKFSEFLLSGEFSKSKCESNFLKEDLGEVASSNRFRKRSRILCFFSS